MSFAIVINALLILLCVAVLVQSVRLLRGFRAIKSGDLAETVRSLDRATAEAHLVLGELRDILAVDGTANARAIASGSTMREELSMMVGIGNAVAERIMDAAEVAGARREEQAAPAPKKAPRAPARKRPAAAASGAQ